MTPRKLRAASRRRAKTRRGAREGRTAPASRSVYFFGGGRAQGTAAMRDRLGGKGANLAEMTRLGVPVPPGFTIVTHVAQAFASAGGRLPDAVLAQARRALSRVERIAGARFGDPDRPLLVSVRSGGCRLGITFPEIYRMQARAIAGAAREVAEAGGAIRPEIMIPLVSHAHELERLRALVLEEVNDCFDGARVRVPFRIGTMIEVPRAALTADHIARSADFFSFGTNDLTQMTYALSRDDAVRFLPKYLETGILADDPFTSIDEEGIGVLITLAAEKGRRARPELKLGLCGEHGGDPKSVRFCARAGLDYVSCSPFRVPIARLAAAQAALADRA